MTLQAALPQLSAQGRGRIGNDFGNDLPLGSRLDGRDGDKLPARTFGLRLKRASVKTRLDPAPGSGFNCFDVALTPS